MARVLVELDITRGLPINIDIECGELLICQKLDYLHVSFICNRCHVVIHLRRSYPLLLHGSSASDLLDFSRSPSCDTPLAVIPTPPAPVIPQADQDGLYSSHSPSVFDDITKGELLFIEDVEACASASKSLNV